MGDDDKFDINLDNITEYSSDGSITIDVGTSDEWLSTDSMYTTNITFDVFGNKKSIDLDLLDKYPAAKHLYNEFISVYNMCEAEEKLNGDGDEYPF